MSDVEHGDPSQQLVTAEQGQNLATASPSLPQPQRSMPRHPVAVRLGLALDRSGPMLAYQLNRIGRTGAAGATVLLFAVVFFFSAVLPQQRELLSLKQQLAQAHHLNGAADSPPVRLNRFMNTLPKRSELPSILGHVFTLAGAAHVALDRGRYELAPTRAGHLAQYRMTFPIKARYPDIRQFIDSVLREVPSAALDGLRIERKTVGDEGVEADLRFSVFVRNDS